MSCSIRTDKKLINHLMIKRIITSDGCWLWRGAHNRDGYGNIKHNYKTWSVHRLAFKLLCPNEFQGHLQVLHKLHCKNRDCFNPDHLYCGTIEDNAKDMILAGTHNLGRRPVRTYEYVQVHPPLPTTK